ncbi:MAG: hypothetical protein WCT31_05415, partial [Candidatus Micrarchaeia archaeon]
MTYANARRAPSNYWPKKTKEPGLEGYVFGAQWGKPRKNLVPSDSDWADGVGIRWESGEITVRCHRVTWPELESNLATVERHSRFPILSYSQELVAKKSPEMPVFLDWGCGKGITIGNLASDPKLKGRALFFGYGDGWFEEWNNIPGVEFLFFV